MNAAPATDSTEWNETGVVIFGFLCRSSSSTHTQGMFRWLCVEVEINFRDDEEVEGRRQRGKKVTP